MPTPTTAADTIATIIPYLKPLTGAVLTLSRTNPETATKVQAAMDGVQSGVVALAASETSAQSQPIVQRIEQDALAVLGVASGLPLPPPFSTIAMVAGFLLPSLFGAVNLLIATKTTIPVAAPTA
jgi:hypothetical protein